MNQDIKQAWVQALRSGKYTQAHERLHDGVGHCCLGVLCELAVDAGVIDPFRVIEDYRDNGEAVARYWYDDATTALPTTVRRWAGVDNDDPEIAPGKSAAMANDGGWTFGEIAEAIAEYL